MMRQIALGGSPIVVELKRALLATFCVQQNQVAAQIKALNVGKQRLAVVDTCGREHAVLENSRLADGDETAVAHGEHAKLLSRRS